MTASTKKKTSSSKRSGSSKIGLWLIGASVAIVALVVIVIVLNEQRTRSTPVAQPDIPAEWIDRSAMGNPDAPVVVQAWEDFLCPSCQAWARGVKPQLVENYVKTGKVRFEFHHFPLQQHQPGSFMSAYAAECAADQGMFWPYHDRLFQMASLEQQSAVEFQDLVGYAREMGMNEQQFSTCMSGEHQDTINQSLAQASQLKLSFTPSILVDGQLVEDSSYAGMQSMIEAALAAKGQQ